MALTFTERGIFPLAEGMKMVATEITGDGSATSITARDIKLERVKFAFLINIDEATPAVLTTNYGTTLTVGAAFESTKKQLLVAVGF